MPPQPPSDPDPLGLHRPAAVSLGDRLAALLDDLGLSRRAAIAGFGLCLLVALGWWWFRAPAPPTAEAEVPLTPAATTAASAPPTASGGVVYAHAAGAVRRPGLYELVAGDRVADLLAAAGGPLGAADLDQVNLAAPVADGTQVIVPRRGEVVAPAPTAPALPGGSTGPGPVNVNTADVAALETLPGVGPATAGAIIEHREANGPFTSVDQLIDVAGIGEAKLAALAGLVAV